MQTFYDVLVWVHIACWALAVLGYVLVLAEPRISPMMSHGVTAAWVLGIALTGIASASDAVDDPNNAKVGVKLLVGLIAVGIAHGTAKRPAPNHFAHVVAALIVVNVGLAYLW